MVTRKRHKGDDIETMRNNGYFMLDNMETHGSNGVNKRIGGTMSETDDYKAKVQPAKRRSKFDPHLEGIRELQRDGYSLEQICEWLWLTFQIGDPEKKGPSSKQVLSAYLRRREGQEANVLPSPVAGKPGKVTQPGPSAPASEEAKPATEASTPTLADALDPEKRQQRADSYITGSGSPLQIGRNKK